MGSLFNIIWQTARTKSYGEEQLWTKYYAVSHMQLLVIHYMRDVKEDVHQWSTHFLTKDLGTITHKVARTRPRITSEDQQLANEVHGRITRRLANETHRRITRKLANEIHDRITRKLTNEIHRRITRKLANEIHEHITRKLANEIHSRITRKLKNSKFAHFVKIKFLVLILQTHN